MSNYIDFESIRVRYYDYSDAGRQRLTRAIKQKFAEACVADKTLDDAYKKHVSNPDNLTVTFGGFGFRVQFRLYSIEIKASYDYSYSTSYVSDVYISSDGHATANKEYTNHRETDTRVYYVRPRRMEEFVCSFGPAITSNMVEITNDSQLPPGLKGFQHRKPTANDIESAVRDFASSNRVRSDVESQIRSTYYGKGAKKIRFDGVYDYDLQTPIQAWCCPTGMFTVKTTYKGKTYSADCDSSLKMEARGPKSASYKMFEDCKKKLRAPFNKFLRVLAFLVTIASGVANCICLSSGHVWPYLVFGVYLLIQAYLCWRIGDNFVACYDDKIPIQSLIKKIKKQFKRNQIANTITMFVFALIPSFFTVLSLLVV